MAERVEHTPGRRLGLLRNVGTLDAVIRVVLGVAMLFLAFLSTATPAVSFVMILGAIILIGTGVAKSCPISEAFRTIRRHR